MKLFELLSTKFTDFKVLVDNTYTYEVIAKIGTREIQFSAWNSTFSQDHYANDWEIEFIEKKDNNKHTYELTKSGNEFVVFSFIKQCLEYFIKKHKPNFIRFNVIKTDEINNRSDLYQKLIIKNLTGYKLNVNNDGTKQIKFTLERIK